MNTAPNPNPNPISSNYGQVVGVIDYGTTNQQSLSTEGQHGGRTVVVNAQPSASAFPSPNAPPPPYSDATPPPSYSDAMAHDQRNQRTMAVLSLLLDEGSRMTAEAHNPPPEKGCCESFCGNGTCGDFVECCCMVTCAIPLCLLYLSK